MEKSMEDLESKSKESLPELLAQIYFYTKEVIAAETGVDVLKTSSFCNFLKELNTLARKHLQVILIFDRKTELSILYFFLFKVLFLRR